jgi:hypothetical protein
MIVSEIKRVEQTLFYVKAYRSKTAKFPVVIQIAHRSDYYFEDFEYNVQDLQDSINNGDMTRPELFRELCIALIMIEEMSLGYNRTNYLKNHILDVGYKFNIDFSKVI